MRALAFRSHKRTTRDLGDVAKHITPPNADIDRSAKLASSLLPHGRGQFEPFHTTRNQGPAFSTPIFITSKPITTSAGHPKSLSHRSCALHMRFFINSTEDMVMSIFADPTASSTTLSSPRFVSRPRFDSSCRFCIRYAMSLGSRVCRVRLLWLLVGRLSSRCCAAWPVQ